MLSMVSVHAKLHVTAEQSFSGRKLLVYVRIVVATILDFMPEGRVEILVTLRVFPFPPLF